MKRTALQPSTKPMKRSPLARGKSMKKLGKQGKLNKAANATLAKNYIEAGLPQYCEAQFPHRCTGREFLGWAHDRKRRKKPDLLHAALICNNAHDIIEVKEPHEMKALVDHIIAEREKV